MIEAIVSVYPGPFIFEPRVWPRARRLDPFILALVANDPPLANDIQVAASQLYDWLGSYRHAAFAAYLEARLMFERALAIREKFLGSEHALTAVSLNNLALVLQDQGDLSAARPLLQRAVAINEKALGAEHRDTAANIGNLAKLLLAKGDYATARRFAERAVAINRRCSALSI
jgi:tetratricopeptide (TPR) repeat protein